MDKAQDERIVVSNVVRTIEDILGVKYLGLNDANARPMSDVFITQPNLQPYIAPIPGILCQPPVDPTLVPECNNPGSRPVTVALKSLHDGAWWAKMTKGFNFSHPDMIDSDKFNRILWKGIMGDDKPYPEPGHQMGVARSAVIDRDWCLRRRQAIQLGGIERRSSASHAFFDLQCRRRFCHR